MLNKFRAIFFRLAGHFIPELYELKWIRKVKSTSLFESTILESNTNNARIFPPYNIYKTDIGLGTYIARNSFISFCEIGKYCSIGPNLVCGWGVHPMDGISTSPVFYSTLNQAGFSYSDKNKIDERKPIKIGHDVFIGMNVTILDGVTIGDGAIIGAGTVVSKDIPPYAIAMGSPIQVIKFRFSDEQIARLESIKWWDFDGEKIKDIEKYFFNIDEFLKKHV